MVEAQASAARAMPPRPNLALSDIDLESSRDTSSVDSHSVVDAAHGAGYFNHPRANNRDPLFVQVPHRVRPPSQYPNQEEPWSPERRRSSLADDRTYASSWPRDGPTPTDYAPPPPNRQPHHHLPHLHLRHHVRPHHSRIPSDISITSSDTSDTSSITNSSASMSPVRYHAQLHSPSGPSGPRRHSTSVPPQRPAQGYSANQRQPSGPSPPKSKNVRWQDMDDVFDAPRHNIPRNRSMDLRGRGDPRNEYRDREDDRRRGARSVGPMTGVGGRRYARSGSAMDWR